MATAACAADVDSTVLARYLKEDAIKINKIKTDIFLFMALRMTKYLDSLVWVTNIQRKYLTL